MIFRRGFVIFSCAQLGDVKCEAIRVVAEGGSFVLWIFIACSCLLCFVWV